MRRRRVLGLATQPDAIVRLQQKFEYPDQAASQAAQILPPLSGGIGAYIHLTRNATQSIASGGEAISWDTLGVQAGFTESVATTSVTIEQAGYYNIAVQFGWSSFTGGGTITILKNGAVAWPPADDPGLWSTDSGQFFEGTAPAIQCTIGDTLSVNVNPDDASAQTLASATFAAYLVDRAADVFYHELVLSHGPLGYWWLDEASGTNAADAAGARDMTYTNTPTLNQLGVMQDGSGSPSVDFTGGEYVAGGDWAEYEFNGTAAFTIECWFVDDLLEGAGTVHELVSKQAADEDGWELLTVNSAGTRELRGVRGTTGGDEQVTTAITIGARHHGVWTFDGTTQRLYLDGVLADSNVAATTMDTTAASVEIGQKTTAATPHMEGKIDEVAIYDRALTAAEIQQHWLVGGG